MKSRITYLALAVLVSLFVVGCDQLGEPEATSTPVLSGRLIPWGTDSPTHSRYIALCLLEDPLDNDHCRLQADWEETDGQGRFSFSGVPAGTYFVLYDSGLSDFHEAIEQWGGETLYFGDTSWLSEFLGVDLSTEPVEFRVPEGISHSPHQGWLTHYCTLTLSVGNSPFIVAHDMELAEDDRDLSCLKVDITSEEAKSITIEAAYFGDR